MQHCGEASLKGLLEGTAAACSIQVFRRNFFSSVVIGIILKFADPL